MWDLNLSHGVYWTMTRADLAIFVWKEKFLLETYYPKNKSIFF